MIPRIVSTIPQNGAEGVALDSTIQVRFSTDLNWDLLRASNFIIRNTTKNLDIPLALIGGFIVDKPTFTITLMPAADLTGSCTYQVIIAGLFDIYGTPLTESYTISFSTVVVSSEVISPPVGDLEIVFTYPSYGAINIAPAVVRIRFSKELDKIDLDLDSTSDLCAFKIFTTEINEDTGEPDQISGTIDPEDLARDTDLVFLPDQVFSTGTSYTVYVSEVKSTDGDTFGPYVWSFTTKYPSCYTNVKSLIALAPVVDLFVMEIGEDRVYQMISAVGAAFEDYLTQKGVTFETTSIYFIDYIKCFTIYEIILDKITRMNSAAQSKTLGDLEISYRDNLSDLLKLLDIWLGRAAKALDALNGNFFGKVRAQAFRKGSDVDTAYEFMSRALRNMDNDTKAYE